MASGGGDFKKFPFWKKYLLFWTPSGAAHIEGWLDGWEIEPVLVMVVLFLLEVWWVLMVDPDAAAAVLAMVVALSPIWLPIYLFNFFWTSWIHYIRFLHWFGLTYVLLKIELPAEVTKSPLAMELFLAGIYNTGGESNFIARIWEGKFRNVFSLEIASNEGRIDFYLRVSEGWRNIIEAKLYGQYPEAKITQVEDYVNQVDFASGEWGLWGHEYVKSAKTADGGRADALPIKTYVEYGLDKNPDEPETQVDPITNLLEHMSTMGPNEYLWMQIMFKARKNDDWYGFYYKDNDWEKGAKEKKEEIMTGAAERAKEKTTDEKKELKLSPLNLSPLEKLQVEAIDRSLSKPVFQCGIRTVYIAKGDTFKGGNIGHVVMWLAPFNYPSFNTFGPTRGTIIFTYPWQDFHDIRMNKSRKDTFFNYKHRAYFYVPYDQPAVYLTTEELATIWHFPSSAVKSSALSRVPSRRAEAPSNLPTGAGFELPR